MGVIIMASLPLSPSIPGLISACRLTPRRRWAAQLRLRLFREGGHRVILRSCEASKGTAVGVVTRLPPVDGGGKSLPAGAGGRLRGVPCGGDRCPGRRGGGVCEVLRPPPWR